MEFKEIGHINYAENICVGENEIYVSSRSMLESYSRKDLTKSKIESDYMGQTEIISSEDCKYIVELSTMRRIKVRDKNSKKVYVSISEPVRGYVPYQGCISIDSKSFFLIITKPDVDIIPSYFIDEINEKYSFKLVELSLPDLRLVRIIDCGETKICNVQRVKFLNSYLLQDTSRRFLMMNQEYMLSLISLPIYIDNDEKIFINEEKEEFYSKTPYGIKIYNRDFIERDSLLFFENDKVIIDNLYSGVKKDKVSKDIFSITDLSSFRKYIKILRVLKSDVLIYTINDMLTQNSLLMYYSFQNNKHIKILELANFIEELICYKETIVVVERRNAHVLEVIDNG